MAKSDTYKKMLNKINSMNLGGGMEFWKPDQGRSTIRILPAIKSMDYFFMEVGVHYLDQGRYYCPKMCTEGSEPCPICEVSSAMYDAGDSKLGGKYRASRSFWMNAIVRGEEGQGPRIFTPGVTIFQTVASYIADPEYGDVTDPWDGFDVKIDRSGAGLQTEYQVRCSREPSNLGTDEEIAEWLENAVDIQSYIPTKLLSYDELIEQSGISIYFDGGEEEEPEPEPEEGEDLSELSASERIQKLMQQRGK